MLGGLLLCSGAVALVFWHSAPLLLSSKTQSPFFLKWCLFCRKQDLEIAPQTSFSHLPIGIILQLYTVKAFTAVLTHC